jgi:hypothetical protein
MDEPNVGMNDGKELDLDSRDSITGSHVRYKVAFI